MSLKYRHVMSSYKKAVGGITAPTDIAGCKLWLDFSDADTLFTDAGSTKVSADGQAIYQANDKSGEGNNALQSLETDRPLYKTNVKNSLSVSRFDGANSMMLLTGMTVAAGSFTFFFVYDNNETLDASSSASGYLLDIQTGRFICAPVTGSATYKEVAWYDGSWHDIADAINGWQTNIFHFTSGGNGVVYRNGSSIGSDSYSEQAIGDAIGLGAKYDTTSPFVKGDIGSVIAYNTALSDANRQSVETYLNNKWSIY